MAVSAGGFGQEALRRMLEVGGDPRRQFFGQGDDVGQTRFDVLRGMLSADALAGSCTSVSPAFP